MPRFSALFMAHAATGEPDWIARLPGFRDTARWLAAFGETVSRKCHLGKDHHRIDSPVTGSRPRTAKADFDDLVVICSKCAKRQGMAKRAFGRSLKRAFKRETHGRKMRVVEAGCLGPCPKRLIAVATPDSISRSRVLLLDPALSPATVRGLISDVDQSGVVSANQEP